VISNYAVHVAELSGLLPGVYAIEIRNENKDAYRLDVSLNIIPADPVPIAEQNEEVAEQEPETDDTLVIAPIAEQNEEVAEQEPEIDDTLAIEPIAEQNEEVAEQESENTENELPEIIETEKNPEQSTTQLTIMYIITMNVGDGGSIQSTPDESIGGIFLSIVPDEGYKITDVVVDDISVGAVEAYAFEAVQANHAITATFEMIPVVEYCITANAGANGSIMPEGTICVPEGSSSEFTIAAHEGNIIADVLVDGIFIGAAELFTFESMSSDHYITAFFATVPVLSSCITAVAGNGGQIIPSGEVCSPGGAVVFSIVPDEGYAIADVLVDGIFIGPVLEYQITERTQDHMIFVSFVHQ
jgi:hypothetical protein